MDYATGIVGIRRGVSWQSISEAVEVWPHQGIKGEQYTKKQLRRALEWLQRRGLLSENRHPAQKRLVFECLLAKRDTCASKKVGRSPTTEAGSFGRSSKSTANSSLYQGYSTMKDHTGNNENAKAGRSRKRKVGIPPLLKSTTATPPAAREEGTAERSATNAKAAAASVETAGQAASLADNPVFPMYYDWQPDAEHLARLAPAWGVNPDSITADFVQRFCLYWSIQHPERQQTQAQWEYQLVQRLKHLQDEAAEKAEKAASSSSRAPARNVVKLRAVESAPPAETAMPSENHATRKTETANPFAEEVARTEAQTAAMGYLWDELRGLYGQRFLYNVGEKTSHAWSAWARALHDLPTDKLVCGLHNLIESAPNWPPSALEFRALCLQIPGLPQAGNAWTQALSGQYGHEAVKQAAQKTGLAELASARNGRISEGQIRALKERFLMHFGLIVEQLKSGETAGNAKADTVEPPATTQQRQELLAEVQHLQRLIEFSRHETEKTSLRSQLERVQAQLAALLPEAAKKQPPGWARHEEGYSYDGFRQRDKGCA